MLTIPDTLLVVALAMSVDRLVGEPDALWRRIPHPVVLIGRGISSLDAMFNRSARSRTFRRAAGIGAVLVLLASSVGAGLLIERLCLLATGGEILIALLGSILIAQKSLLEHVSAVHLGLSRNLDNGRHAVAMIVGRSPDSLDGAGVARAAIESCAENFSDGVVAPAFWFLIGGLPGLIAYKAINTADSMIGHKSERYEAFGWAAARLDDLLNLLPARISGVLIALAAPAAGGSPRRACAVMRADASRHRSPNAGWPEAAMAGALGLALAGPRRYATHTVDDPWLNPGATQAANSTDIARCLKVTERAWGFGLAFVLLAGAALSF